jgi:hypothetical protein
VPISGVVSNTSPMRRVMMTNILLGDLSVSNAGNSA